MRSEILANLDSVSPEAWSALVDPRQPFLNRDYLRALERHGAASPRLGWTAQHLALRDDAGGIVGMLPLYLKHNSFGEFIYDWSWANAWRQAGLAYYPKLFTGIPYTPATGSRLLSVSGPRRTGIRARLVEAALELAREQAMPSWHVAFPAGDEVPVFKEAGLLGRSDVQFHWFNRGYRDFQDFLDSLASDKRRKLRAERRKVREAGIAVELRHGHEVEPGLWRQVHALYEATFDRFGNHPAISAACFAEIGAALRERMLLFIARRGTTPVAVSICYRSDDALYGRYWGAHERIDGLHFDLCYYTGIEYCIGHGLGRFEPGAGGEHKVARGFEPTAVTTLHWIADPRMREVLREHLARVDKSVEHYRGEAAEHLPFRNEEASR